MLKGFVIKNFLNERLELILTDPDQSGIIVESVTGLGPGKVTVNIKEIANGDGGSFNGARTPVRNIVMNLIFIADPTIEDTRQKTYRYFPTMKPLTLEVITDNHTLCIDGYVESNEPDIFSDQEGCQISILCPNPYFYTKDSQITTSSGETPMFEFPVDNELIKNPVLDPKIPSDEEYVTIVENNIGSLSNSSIKQEIFQTEYEDIIRSYTVTESLDGTIPYKAMYKESSLDQKEVKTLIFALRFPWGTTSIENAIDNGDFYSLDFLVDAEILLLNSANAKNKKLFFEIIQDDDKIYEPEEDGWVSYISPTTTYDKIIKSKDLEFSINITKDILTKIKSGLPLMFHTYQKILYTNNSGATDNPDYIDNFNNFYEYIFNVHDVTLHRRSLEKRTGYADEEILWYKWNDNSCADRVITNGYVNRSLIFPYKDSISENYYISRTLYEQPIKDIIGNDYENRKFIIRFDLNCKILKSLTYNGTLMLKVSYQSESYLLEKRIASFTDGEIKDGLYKDLEIEITSDIYYKIFMSYETSSIIFEEFYTPSYAGSTDIIHLNPEEVEIKVTNIRFYEVLQPSKDYDENEDKKNRYLVDPTIPNYEFEKNGITYNLQASEGIIMGEIQKHHFNHYVEYNGNKSIGFQMTIEFLNSLNEIEKNGIMDGDPGYIVIKSNFYPGKNMIIDLNDVKEILPEAKSDAITNPKANIGGGDLDQIDPEGEINLIPPVGQKGDLIFIDTRKKKKSVRYQKPNGFKYETNMLSVKWDYEDYKINILPATNRDIEWFEINQGLNIFTIYHTHDPKKEILSEEELKNVHANRLAVEIKNSVYYEGV